MSQSPAPAHPPRRPFTKPWLPCADHLPLLTSRGLIISDPVEAEAFLTHINYYRFSGYCLAFEERRHVFIPGTTFEQVRAAHDFDRVLRDLLNEALEVIEVDLRTASAIHIGQTYGPFGHTVAANFYRAFDLTKLREEAQRSSEVFVQHFRATYTEFPDLPIWAVTETMSFGALSIMIKCMHRNDQIAIARRYGLHHTVLLALAHHAVYLRNLCAHHARVWDRQWSIQPTLPRGREWQPPAVPAGDRLYATLLLFSSMLRKCPTALPFRDEWRQRVEDLLRSPPSCPDASIRLGLPQNWRDHPAWH